MLKWHYHPKVSCLKCSNNQYARPILHQLQQQRKDASGCHWVFLIRRPYPQQYQAQSYDAPKHTVLAEPLPSLSQIGAHVMLHQMKRAGVACIHGLLKWQGMLQASWSLSRTGKVHHLSVASQQSRCKVRIHLAICNTLNSQTDGLTGHPCHTFISLTQSGHAILSMLTACA